MPIVNQTLIINHEPGSVYKCRLVVDLCRAVSIQFNLDIQTTVEDIVTASMFGDVWFMMT